MPEQSDAVESSTQLPVTPPTRGADRNRDLADGEGPRLGERLFPDLGDGITLLDVEGGRGVPVVQSLVLDRLLADEGPAVWVDAEGYAATTGLSRIAPSRRLLDRIRVARAFTACGHYAAVRDVPDVANRCINASAGSPSLIVAPAVDARYRDADGLAAGSARSLLARTLARLRTCADAYDAPVLVTRTGTDDLAAPVERTADRRVTCERTRMGPRFVGEDFETLLYPVECGAYYQTTFAYWRRVLDARARAADPAGPSPAADEDDAGPESVGEGVTADGSTATLAADPLLDAWAGGR